MIHFFLINTSLTQFLSDFFLTMKLSGYSERYKEMIINSAWSAWDKMLNKVSKGVTPLYRVREWRKNKSYKEKKRKRTRWFWKLGGDLSHVTTGGRLVAK